LNANLPDTPSQNGPIYASSITNNVWSDESFTVLKFKTGFNQNQFYVLLFGFFGFNLLSYSGTPSERPAPQDIYSHGLGHWFEWSVPAATNLSPNVNARIRVREITSDFDTATLTWNTRGSLTYGQVVFGLESYEAGRGLDSQNFYSHPTGTTEMKIKTAADIPNPQEHDMIRELVNIGFIPGSRMSNPIDLGQRGLRIVSSGVKGLALEVKPYTDATTYLTKSWAWAGLSAPDF